MADNPRLEFIRDDLKIQITDLYPSPGTLLVIHPCSPEVIFNSDYSNWIQVTLEKLLPAGVKAMVVSQNVTEFDNVQPKEGGYDYLKGWNDAIKAIAEVLA